MKSTLKWIVCTVALGALSGCSIPWVKSADEACGAFPVAMGEGLAETAAAEGVDRAIMNGMAAQPVDYVRCRSEHGDRYAASEYARRLLAGEGVARNPEAAARLFEFAGMPDNGYTPVYMAGFGSVPAQTQMIKTRPATSGVAMAQFELGRMYLEGLGVKQSDKKAKKWLKRAAGQGHKEAARLLAALEPERNS